MSQPRIRWTVTGKVIPVVEEASQIICPLTANRAVRPRTAIAGVCVKAIVVGADGFEPPTYSV